METKEEKYLVQVIVNGEAKVAKVVTGLDKAKEYKERLTKHNRRNLVVNSEEHGEQQDTLYGTVGGIHTVVSVNYQKMSHGVEGNELGTIIFDLGEETEVMHQIPMARLFFRKAKEGVELFSIFKNDKGYHVGDLIQVNECVCGSNTGNSVKVRVTKVIDHPEQVGHVVLGVQLYEKVNECTVKTQTGVESNALEVIHNLKIAPTYFKAVKEGKKLFEIRKNDRDYHVGDILLLNEYTCGSYTGEFIKVEVTYITDYAQKDGYVVLGIKLCEK